MKTVIVRAAAKEKMKMKKMMRIHEEKLLYWRRRGYVEHFNCFILCNYAYFN